MGDLTTIRAWKDVDFRASLESAEGAAIDESPVGTIELADDDLGDPSGGMVAITQTTFCATTLACLTSTIIIASDTISCGACDTTLWHGTCSASSIGCC